MAEYIVDVSPLAELYEKAGHERHPFTQIANCPINGRIVRCKDCEFLAIDRWFGTDYFCSMLRMTIEPNGFCSWGEEKKDD